LWRAHQALFVVNWVLVQHRNYKADLLEFKHSHLTMSSTYLDEDAIATVRHSLHTSFI